MEAKRSKPESPILTSVHETAAGLHSAGLIDKAKKREFDALCVAPMEPPMRTGCR